MQYLIVDLTVLYLGIYDLRYVKVFQLMKEKKKIKEKKRQLKPELGNTQQKNENNYFHKSSLQIANLFQNMVKKCRDPNGPGFLVWFGITTPDHLSQ